MRIGFVGGGSGGHFYPLIAVAEELRQSGENVDLYYFGPEQYDSAELANNNITFVRIPAGKLRRYFSLLNILDFFKTAFGLLVAIGKLYVVYPDVIFSKGGFTSVPILLAARFFRIPVVIHESDSVPGRANKLARKFARYCAISFESVASEFPADRTARTGIPIRKQVREPHGNPHQLLGLDPSLHTIFVTGGSTGADRVNTLVLESLDELLPTYQILHQTGVKNEQAVRQTASQLHQGNQFLGRYVVVGSLTTEQMAAALTAASIVISRAGSTTLFEIAWHGKPSIVIPIPEDVSHDQRRNAFAYARTGAASVLEESNLRDGLLAAEINTIMTDPGRYQTMSTAARSFVIEGAAKKIADILVSIGHEHGS